MAIATSPPEMKWLAPRESLARVRLFSSKGGTMPSIKLSVTHRGRLKAKYKAKGLAAIDQAIATWVAQDKARGFTTIHLAVDDAAALAPFKVKPLAGAVTPTKVKAVVDALWKKLTPDYLVLVGAHDVVPHFEVANPTLSQPGDTDARVPTDNPYACSQAFAADKRATYLIPDRVCGRIPDLPGADDPAALLAALGLAASWKSKKAKAYATDLLACCQTWQEAGRECAAQLGRAATRLQIVPPEGAATPAITKRHGALLQMIKGHGARLDSRFFGQLGDDFPDLVTSASLADRTRESTMIGAMCCFSASLFDPTDPAAQVADDPPIPLVFLSQRAFGFAGSTTTAWVGVSTMQCADWVVTGFLKSVLAGASTGRALLEAKQDFFAWIEKQGTTADLADEKTLLQFLLLGDPAVHPVGFPQPAAAVPAGAVPAGLAIAPAAIAEVAAERRARRAYRVDLKQRLVDLLPARRRLAATAKLPREAPVQTAQTAQRMMEAPPVAAKASKKASAAPPSAAPALAAFIFDFSRPIVEEVSRKIAGPAPAAMPKAALAAAGAPQPTHQTALEYYWAARREIGPVKDICLIRVTADKAGNVLRSRVIVSS